MESVAAEHLGLHVSNFGVNWLLDALYNERRSKGFLVFMEDVRAIDAVKEARQAARQFFKDVHDSRTTSAPANGRLTERGFVHDGLSTRLQELATALEGLKSKARDGDVQGELVSYRNKAMDLASAVTSFVNLDAPGRVYWVEAGESARGRVALECSPIDVAGSSVGGSSSPCAASCSPARPCAWGGPTRSSSSRSVWGSTLPRNSRSARPSTTASR